MVTRGAIGLLHAGVAQTFMGLLEGECEIEPPSEFRANWHRRELEEKISFQLWQKGARQQIGVRTGGGAKCPLVPGQVVNPAWDNGERAWVAWREIWKRESHDAFSLEEAAFTFFWGRPSVEPITNQLFRAEWPQRTIGGKTLAQPHWQVDWPLADLEHVVAGIHFGMAGWECQHPPDEEENEDEDENHLSKNWRRFAEGETVAILERWSARTLEYSLDQIVRFYPKDLV